MKSSEKTSCFIIGLNVRHDVGVEELVMEIEGGSCLGDR
jgi:hypothetical protein